MKLEDWDLAAMKDVNRRELLKAGATASLLVSDTANGVGAARCAQSMLGYPGRASDEGALWSVGGCAVCFL
jgi:hypothetical protein